MSSDLDPGRHPGPDSNPSTAAVSPRHGCLRAEQINLLSRTQAVQLYGLLVPSS